VRKRRRKIIRPCSVFWFYVLWSVAEQRMLASEQFSPLRNGGAVLTLSGVSNARWPFGPSTGESQHPC